MEESFFRIFFIFIIFFFHPITVRACPPCPLVPFEKETVTISDKGSHPGGVCKGGCQN